MPDAVPKNGVTQHEVIWLLINDVKNVMHFLFLGKSADFLLFLNSAPCTCSEGYRCAELG